MGLHLADSYYFLVDLSINGLMLLKISACASGAFHVAAGPATGIFSRFMSILSLIMFFDDVALAARESYVITRTDFKPC